MSAPGIVLDSRFLDHVTPEGHPENAGRLGLLFGLVNSLEAQQRIQRIHPRHATREEILLVHSAEHLGRVEATRNRDLSFLNPDTPVCRASCDTALLAVGGALEALDALMSGTVPSAMVLARPPGHHAEVHRAMGYCLFNTVALAARYARTILGISRVAIIDWDVHHGNGTQHIHEKDPSVLFISIHQFPHFPGSGLFTESGLGPGEGYTVNIPLSKGYGNAEYAALFTGLVRPMVTEFMPELMLVSAGFDIQDTDPMGGMKVTPSGFAAMTRAVLDMAGECRAKPMFVLEGGYDPDGLFKSIAAVLDELCGVTTADLQSLAAVASLKKIHYAMTRTSHVHQAFWNCWREYVQ